MHQLQAEAVQPERQRTARQNPSSVVRGGSPEPLPQVRRRQQPVFPGRRQPDQIRQQLLQKLSQSERASQLRPSSVHPKRHVGRFGEEICRRRRTFLQAIRKINDQNGQHFPIDGLKWRDQKELQENQQLN